MAIKTGTILVETDIAEAWNAASAATRKRIQAKLKRELLKGATIEKDVPHLSREESELLLQIGRSLPPKQWDRFGKLTERSKSGEITKVEQVELQQLTR